VLAVARTAKSVVLAAAPEGKVMVVLQQEMETALLPFIEALVKRLQGVRIPFERGTTSRQHVSQVVQALDRIKRFVGALIVRVVGVQGGEIPIGLLDCGPCLFLVGG
jgi:hypothetical protein